MNYLILVIVIKVAVAKITKVGIQSLKNETI